MTPAAQDDDDFLSRIVVCDVGAQHLGPFLSVGSAVRLVLTRRGIFATPQAEAMVARACETTWGVVNCSAAAYPSFVARALDANLQQVVDVAQAAAKGRAALSALSARLYVAEPAIRRLARRAVGSFDKRHHRVPRRRRDDFCQAIVGLARVKTCRDCYSLRTAIVVLDRAVEIECHACGARRRRPPVDGLAKLRDWDKLNVLPADLGVEWYSDPSPAAVDARRRAVLDEQRRLTALCKSPGRADQGGAPSVRREASPN